MKRPKKATKKQDYTKGWETRRRNAAKREGEAQNAARQRPLLNRPPADTMTSHGIARQATAAEQGRIPGHGEIIGGTDGIEEAAVRICKLARKRGAYGIVNSELRALLHHTTNKVRIERDRAATERVIKNQDEADKRVVCGFLTEIHALERMYGGLPQDLTLPISAYTVLKIVDVLNGAGYTPRGYSAPRPLADLIRDAAGAS